MVFSSLFFIFLFLPAFLIVYYLTPGKYKNYTALVGSLFFYAWGAPWFVFILLTTCVADYFISRVFPNYPGGSNRRKQILAVAIIYNLLLLGYFKYTNFFVGQINFLFDYFGWSTLSWNKVILPIGISFFTFHKVSYLVDVYRDKVKPATNLFNFLLYITLFPQLIAGPIVRYHDIADQLVSRRHNLEKVFAGILRFVVGLSKKVLIANVLGRVADTVFLLDPGNLTFFYAWLGAISYAFQIYFDFSGYSDMAIGLAKMMGFDFLENFNRPYIAQSFTEFWRRWHISLSNFLREYLYIPLGGNRVVEWRKYFNLWLVFFVSGFWHGANWTFIIWGIYHGFFVILDKIFWLKLAERVPKLVNIIVTFILILFGWVVFRAETLSSALVYWGRMLGVGSGYAHSTVLFPEVAGFNGLFTLVLAFLICFLPGWRRIEDWKFFTVTDKKSFLIPQLAVSVALLVLAILSLVNSSFNPFIYFRF